MPKSKAFYALAAVSIFLLSTGLSYWFFGYLKNSKSITPSTPNPSASSPVKKSKIDPSIPRTEVCPLNGALFTKQESDVWVTRRPLAVMIENSLDARPQSGLSTADIVYEAVAEGGITRFMGVFHCNAALSGNLMIAPVRSARIYFVNIVAEYDALYNHVGGAGNCDDINVDPRAKALCAIRKNNIKDIDQFGLDFKTCHRVTNRLDKDVAYEHTMACFLDELYKAGEDRGWTNLDAKKVPWDKSFIPWQFKTVEEMATGEPATSVSYSFWGDKGNGEEFNKAFDVSWAYDAASKSYTRSNASTVSTDLNTSEPLKFSNVVVQFAKETSTGDLEHHMLYDNIGTGKAIVFVDGVATNATWSKSGIKARTVFKDAKGAQIKFNPGPIWISILPIGNTVVYQ